MADEEFHFCKSIWNDNLAMQRLVSILRQIQNYCTDHECFNVSSLPGPRGETPHSNFLVTCLIIAFIVVMYVLRPNSLRQTRNNNIKDRRNEHDPSDDSPAPPTSN